MPNRILFGYEYKLVKRLDRGERGCVIFEKFVY